MQRIADAVLLTSKEYLELTDPDKCYSLVTKTLASKAVKRLLEHEKFVCFHDQDPVPDSDDACCSICPAVSILGEAGERMCPKQKWSGK
jgi:hypothetical protein